MADLSLGFSFEQVVLGAWQMGLGTCWIAATFKGTDFERGVVWPRGERLRIVCPVGKPASLSVKERLMRFAVRSNRRKPFDTLFFKDDFAHPLSPDSAFGEALEMMRLAPSSTNSQPWRALVREDAVLFYYKPKSSLSVLDCGIGLCHFDAAERFRGRAGEFVFEDKFPPPPEDWKYLVTYHRMK